MSVIQVEDLGKKYIIGYQQKTLGKYVALRDVIAEKTKDVFEFIVNPAAKMRSESEKRAEFEEFWALKGVSFDINEGDKVGIIGRNGAGKSTALKILSRITEPTKGRVSIKGRVASLLEVGTGFHPELTGRENIFLNGAILGMTNREIKSKFDEIVAFAEVERFLDTPVKRYSSGMYVRLAFAVAAHLEPEILLVDEVLAVGDIQFQKKCLGKMEKVASEGRTVIFVSHNMEAIQRLCNRVILLGDGKVLQDGPTADVINRYMQTGPSEVGEKVWTDQKTAPGDDSIRIHAVRLKDKHNKMCTNFDVRDPVSIELDFWVKQSKCFADAEVILYDRAGHIILYSVDNTDSSWKGKGREPGLYRSVCHVPGDLLNEGTISVTAAVSTIPHTCHAVAKEVVSFEVTDCMDPEGSRGDVAGVWPTAAVRPRLKWDVSVIEKK